MTPHPEVGDLLEGVVKPFIGRFRLVLKVTTFEETDRDGVAAVVTTLETDPKSHRTFIMKFWWSSLWTHWAVQRTE